MGVQPFRDPLVGTGIGGFAQDIGVAQPSHLAEFDGSTGVFATVDFPASDRAFPQDMGKALALGVVVVLFRGDDNDGGFAVAGNGLRAFAQGEVDDFTEMIFGFLELP